MTKKVFSFLLLLMGVAQGAMAQEAYAALSDDGLTVTFYYDDQKASRSGVVEINNSLYGSNPYRTATTAIFDDTFVNYQPTSTAYWFDGCNLTSIIGIENLNTENVTDMGSMFSSCDLTSLDLSSFDTGNVTDMSSMFYGCRLTSLDLSSFDTRNVTDMSKMFQSSYGLTSLNLSSFDTGNVRDMSYMFDNCYRLTSIDLSNFDTGNVTNMYWMFNGCSGLKSLDVSSFNTGNVTDMGYMFSGCRGLTSLDVSGFNTGNVKNMSSMFTSCSRLTSLDVSNFDTGNVKNMSYMFFGCSQLTSLDVSGFDTGNVTDMSNMFASCSGLTSLDVSNFDTRNVMNMGSMFRYCYNLTSIYCNDTWSCPSSSQMFYGCSQLPGYSVSSTNDVAYAKPIADGGYFTPKTENTNAVAGDFWWTYYTDVRNTKADENTTVYTATLNADGTQVELNEVEDKIVPRGQAVILKSTVGEPLLYTITGEYAGTFPANDLQGTQREKSTADVEGAVYTLAAEGGKLGFYRYTGTKLAARKAFLLVEGAGARSIAIAGNEETGISDVAEQAAEGIAYDLQGRRVSEPQKGLYIVNGKKIVKR